MARLVGVWFAKFGQETTTAPAAAETEAEAEAGRRHQSDGALEVESGKKCGGVLQERRRRNSGVLSNSEATVCMLMDRFAPA